MSAPPPPRAPLPHLDVDQLAASVRELAKTIRKGAGEPVFYGEPDGKRMIAILLKRTYVVENGECVLAPEPDQAPLCFENVPYEEIRPPFVSPLITVDESTVFKPKTDLVIQALAHAYRPKTTTTNVSFRFGKFLRELVVHGKRTGRWDASQGRPRFSEPEPFECMPIRWDRAYGGFDGAAVDRNAERLELAISRMPPSLGAYDVTPYHYPRNPCGVGYLMDLDRESFEDIDIPNLEHPFDPLTPERLAVGGPTEWLRGALPAAWDYQDLSWFPRCGYLGLTPSYNEDHAPGELKQGWAASDILETENVVHATSPKDCRREFTQAAAPGLSVDGFQGNEHFEFRNLHKNKPFTR